MDMEIRVRSTPYSQIDAYNRLRLTQDSVFLRVLRFCRLFPYYGFLFLGSRTDREAFSRNIGLKVDTLGRLSLVTGTAGPRRWNFFGSPGPAHVPTPPLPPELVQSPLETYLREINETAPDRRRGKGARPRHRNGGAPRPATGWSGPTCGWWSTSPAATPARAWPCRT